VRDTYTQKVVTERADFSVTQATWSPIPIGWYREERAARL